MATFDCELIVPFRPEITKRIPNGSVIACSLTSPLDILCLTALVNPVFTQSYSSTQRVRTLGFVEALLLPFAHPLSEPPPKSGLKDVSQVMLDHPKQPVVIFPECTTTNGKGVLRLCGSILTAPANSPIVPVSIRYTPGHVVTPIPGDYTGFLWRLLTMPFFYIRLRTGNAFSIPHLSDPLNHSLTDE